MSAVTASIRPVARQTISRRLLTGIGTMIRLILRRNWLRMIIWATVLVIMIPIVYASQRQTFPTQAARDAYARVADTPSVAAMTGLPYAAGSLGGILVIKIWMTLAVALCFAVIFAITHNGRADEEVGRTELLRSAALGRHAYTVANLSVTAAFSIVVGLAISGACLAVGLPVAGSWSMGASIAGVGVAFTGIAAICGQLMSTSRSANGLSVLVLALSYLIRAAADLAASGERASSASPDPLSWASPIGWAQNMRAFGADHWWPFALLVGLGAVTAVVALVIEAHRDLGAGVVAARPGPADASDLLRRPIGLAIRLQRGSMVGWALGVLVAGAFFGGVATAMASLVDPGTATAKLFVGRADDVIDGVLALFVLFIALLAAAYAVQSVSAARLEEAAGRLEMQLAGALSRFRWLGTQVVVTVVWSTVIMAVGGAVIGLAYGRGALRLTGSALAYWPAVLLLVGVVLFLTGWLPRLTTAVAWAIYGLSTVIAMFGGLLSLPQDLIDHTPFAAVPRLPSESLSWPPLLVLTGIAVLLAAAGIWRFCRRDLAPE